MKIKRSEESGFFPTAERDSAIKNLDPSLRSG
jgi:hypothetical protein